jgi:hypothetical protein
VKPPTPGRLRPVTLLRLALAGTRTDTLRVALTAVSATLATLAVLAAVTVLSIPGAATRYRSNLLAEPGLRPGLAIALVLLTIPVLALAAQSGRLGAPARDRRLAAIRLAGATPRQTVAVVITETGLANVIGVTAGYAVYLGGRPLLHRPDAAGRLALPPTCCPRCGRWRASPSVCRWSPQPSPRCCCAGSTSPRLGWSARPDAARRNRGRVC